MLKIRLQRVGRRNRAAFRVVVTESTRGPKSGRNVEILGTYSPHTNIATLKSERVQHWIEHGAQVSPTARNILVNQTIIKGGKINVLPRKSPVLKKDGETAEKQTEKGVDEEGTSEAERDERGAGEEEEGEVGKGRSEAEKEEEKAEKSDTAPEGNVDKSDPPEEERKVEAEQKGAE